MWQFLQDAKQLAVNKRDNWRSEVGIMTIYNSLFQSNVECSRASFWIRSHSGNKKKVQIGAVELEKHNLCGPDYISILKILYIKHQLSWKLYNARKCPRIHRRTGASVLGAARAWCAAELAAPTALFYPSSTPIQRLGIILYPLPFWCFSASILCFKQKDLLLSVLKTCPFYRLITLLPCVKSARHALGE